MLKTTERKLFTIGHSNQTTERFLNLLSDNGIQVLVDVRSHPYSKFASQFNGPSLKEVIAKRGVRYLYLGRELGGKPEGPSFYDKDGHALYFQIAESPDFLKAVA
ncbi:MAG: DUF488 domain-containing protein, partial [Pseudomonadota bacterium]